MANPIETAISVRTMCWRSAGHSTVFQLLDTQSEQNRRFARSQANEDPLPPPIGAGNQTFRSVGVANGAFENWFGPHDAHVYRFTL